MSPESFTPGGEGGSKDYWRGGDVTRKGQPAAAEHPRQMGQRGRLGDAGKTASLAATPWCVAAAETWVWTKAASTGKI